ncbi:unnamed protein product [Caenorhabditis angaria]|uniref:Uncharacterized protein n=1 Tax=Caenorhabditis angaria TaxID=860376 RepID=A0A9P1J1S7_9PELO|nr:unnamed protein product [Caenorhabditis angaria]
MGSKQEEWPGPSTSQPGPSNSHIVINPLAGQYGEIAEIPPFRGKKAKPKKPVPEPIDPETARLRLLAEKRRCVAISKAYNLFTDEEIQQLPPEIVPRSIYFGAIDDDIETGTNQIENEIEHEIEDEQQPIMEIVRPNRGRIRQVVHDRWIRFRNFFRRIRQVIMSNFFDSYAPTAHHGMMGTTEEESLAIEHRSRTVIPEEEKMHVHMLYIRQMEANQRPTPYVEPTYGDRKTKVSQEYIDFVMYKDLQPLVELKKWKTEENCLKTNVTEARNALNKVSKVPKKIDEEEEETEDPKASDPLLVPDNERQGTSKDA